MTLELPNLKQYCSIFDKIERIMYKQLPIRNTEGEKKLMADIQRQICAIEICEKSFTVRTSLYSTNFSLIVHKMIKISMYQNQPFFPYPSARIFKNIQYSARISETNQMSEWCDGAW